jgi:hypothetical protein
VRLYVIEVTQFAAGNSTVTCGVPPIGVEVNGIPQRAQLRPIANPDGSKKAWQTTPDRPAIPGISKVWILNTGGRRSVPTFVFRQAQRHEQLLATSPTARGPQAPAPVTPAWSGRRHRRVTAGRRLCHGLKLSWTTSPRLRHLWSIGRWRFIYRKFYVRHLNWVGKCSLKDQRIGRIERRHPSCTAEPVSELRPAKPVHARPSVARPFRKVCAAPHRADMYSLTLGMTGRR